MKYQQFNRCIMFTTASNVIFNKDGIRSFRLVLFKNLKFKK